MPKHYIIGDIHGEYQTLLALVGKLTKDAKLIFVGDLIDRGSQSREVIKFIRENNHRSVLGNHEALFAKFGLEFIDYFEGNREYHQINQRWHKSGRFETFLSYGVIETTKDGEFNIIGDKKKRDILKNDIEWMQKNPLYIELDVQHSSGKKVVISHSNISKVWNIRHNKKKKI